MGKIVEWNEGLSDSALAIAQSTASPLRVLAGPGTGKTYTMMRRVARLLQEGNDPTRILVCTFTRTAATDLKKSLALLGTEGSDLVNANTIHSFCFSMLSKTHVMAITGRIPRPLLEYEIRFLLEDLKCDNIGGLRKCKAYLKAFDAAWARLDSDEPGWPVNVKDKYFHKVLLNWLKFHKAILLSELIFESLLYLRNNPLSPYRKAYDHVLVDEYQDLNRADQVLIDYLVETGTLTVIGDENQSIYSTLRYAHPEGVTNFKEKHPNTHDEKLINCHRCPKIIVNIANSLISNNTKREDRPIQYMINNPTGELYIVQWSDIESESKGLAKYIKSKIINMEIEAGKILILSPYRAFGYSIKSKLSEIGIPAHSFFHEEEFEGDPRVLKESKAQQAFSLLIMLANSEDYVSLRCWCGFGRNSLNKKPWDKIREHCEKIGDTPLKTIEKLLSGELSIPHTKPVVDRYKNFINRRSELNTLTGQELVDSLFPLNESWAQPIRSLSSKIENNNFDAKILLEHLKTNITQPELPTEVDYVRIMSLHKSKGLTAEMVIVLGCIEGLIPKIDKRLTQAEQTKQLEEQRRLFYVAITRAKQILILSNITSLSRKLAFRISVPVIDGNKNYASTIASPFISQLGSSCPNTITGRDFLKITT